MTKHAAVWIDHHEAKIFLVDESGAIHPEKLRAPEHIRRHSSVTAEHAHPEDLLHFFQSVEKALADIEEILVVGPGSAKLELIKHVHKHAHTLEPRIVGVETVDHPTDGQLVKHAHAYFHAKDRLLGTAP
jgi:stalled ribosome rescue protein Dom34